MKHLWMIIGFLLLCGPVFAQDFIVTSDEYIVVSGNVSDTLGRTRLTPDSMRIVVTDSAGTELFDAWFEAADAQAVLNGDIISFSDQWDDINGAASVGTFSLMVTIGATQNSIKVFSNYNYTIRGVTVGVEAMHGDVAGLNGWAPILDNDSLIIDQSTLEDMTVATVTTVTDGATASGLDSLKTNIIAAAGDIVDSVTNSGAEFKTDLTNAVDDHYNDQFMIFTSGTNAGQARRIIDYAGTPKYITIFPAFEVEPTAGDDFTVLVNTANMNVYTMRADVITAGTIAANAFDADAFATDAIDEFWEFDTANFDAAAGVGTAIKNIQDTTDAQGSAGAGAISDADMVSIADTVWKRSWAYAYTAGSIGDSLTTASYVQAKVSDIIDTVNGIMDSIQLGLNMAAISGDATAADNLEDVYDESGTSGVEMELKSLKILNIAGDAVTITAGTAGGDPVPGDGVVITSIQGNAVELIANDTALFIKGTVRDIEAQLESFNFGTNAINANTIAPDAIGSSELAGSAAAEIADTSENRTFNANMVQISGDAVAADNFETMLDSTGGKPFTVSQIVIKSSGNNTALDILGAGTGHGIRSFSGGAGGAVAVYLNADVYGTNFNTSNFTTAFFDSAQGSASGLTAVDIWNVAFNTGFTAGSMGDSVNNSSYVQGTASGLTKEAVADAVLDSMEVGTRQVNYRSLTVDSGTVFAATNTGVGFTVTGGASSGDATKFTATDGDGLSSEGGATGRGFYLKGGATNGPALYAVGGGGNSNAISLLGTGSSDALRAEGGATGAGVTFRGGSSSGNAIALSVTSGDLIQVDAITATTIADNAIDYATFAASEPTAWWNEGKTGYSLTASQWELVWYLIDTTNVDSSDIGDWFKNNIAGGAGSGLDTLSTVFQLRLATLFADTNWQSTLADRDGVAGSFGDSAKYWKGIKDGGTGFDTLQIRAVDTSGTDNSVANVTIVAVSPGGSVVARGTTDANGLVLFELDAGVVYSITGVGPNFQQWNNPTSMTNTAGYNPTSDTLFGWSISTAVPAATKTAAVLVILKDASGAPAEGVNVSAYLLRSNLTDSSGAGVVNIPQNIKTDATGVATFTCRWSSYLIPATKWRFQAHVPGSGGIRRDYTVPRVTIDTLNLAD